MMSLVLRQDGTVQVENGEANSAFRWLFVETSMQLVLLIDHAMRPRPLICLLLNWIDGNLWADPAGNYVVFASSTGWPVRTHLRSPVPLASLPSGQDVPVTAFHWLSGKRDREFIVGFQDGTCAYYGRDKQWTAKHGACRLIRFDAHAFLIVKFHYQAVMLSAYVSVFEKSDYECFLPVKEYSRLIVLNEFLTHSNYTAASELVDAYEMTGMPDVAVLPVSGF